MISWDVKAGLDAGILTMYFSENPSKPMVNKKILEDGEIIPHFTAHNFMMIEEQLNQLHVELNSPMRKPNFSSAESPMVRIEHQECEEIDLCDDKED